MISALQTHAAEKNIYIEFLTVTALPQPLGGLSHDPQNL